MQTGFRTSFRGHYTYSKTNGYFDYDGNTAEVHKAQKARSAKVDVPKYDVESDTFGVKKIDYVKKGKTADIKTNPIGRQHLKNLFKNLYYLDKAGIYHDELDRDHIFFAENGAVELDYFRHSYDFIKKQNKPLLKKTDYLSAIRMPDFAMPSNAINFETLFLPNYIDDIRDPVQKDDFIKNYLNEKSNYHQKRVDMLLGRGFDPLDKTVQYETIQGEVFKNPTRNVVNYTKLKSELFKKLDILYNRYETESPQEDLAYFDCLVDILKLRKNIKISSLSSQDKNETKYFAFEDEILNKIFNDFSKKTQSQISRYYQEDIDAMYDDGLEHSPEYCTDDDEYTRKYKTKRKFFLDLYSEIDPDNKTTEENIAIIENAKAIFNDDYFW